MNSNVAARCDDLYRQNWPSTKFSAGIPDKASESDLDRLQLLDRVDGDLTFLSDLIEIFAADFPRALATIRGAIFGRDATGLNRAAHAFKGALSNFGNGRSFDEAQKLERLGLEQKFAEAEVSYGVLEDAVQQLHAALATFIEREPSLERSANPETEIVVVTRTNVSSQE